MCLFKCITRLLSENPLAVNVLTSSKNSWNLEKNNATFSSFEAKLSYKNFFLMRSDILGLVVNTLTANYEYSLSNRENFPIPIRINLSKIPFTTTVNLLKFLEFAWNFKCSEKKVSLIGEVFPKLLTLKDILFWIHNRASLWKAFGSEHVNWSQKLAETAEKYFYHTFSSFWAKLS